MSNPSPSFRELDRLIDAALADEISNDDLVQLGEVLRSDERARRRFLDLSALEADIFFSVRLARADAEARFATSARPASKSLRPKALLKWASRNPKGPAVAVAATVLIAVLATMAVTPVSKWFVGIGKNSKVERRTDGRTDSEFVAILNNSKNDIWLEGNRPKLRDPRLRVGGSSCWNRDLLRSCTTPARAW